MFQFMNLVLDETVEVVSTTEKTDIGMVVRAYQVAYHCSNVLEKTLLECLSRQQLQHFSLRVHPLSLVERVMQIQ